MLATSTKKALQSAFTTFVVVLFGQIPIEKLTEGDFSWLPAVGVAALLAAIRTLAVALNPLDDSYGVNAAPEPPAEPEVTYVENDDDESYHPDDLAEKAEEPTPIDVESDPDLEGEEVV